MQEAVQERGTAAVRRPTAMTPLAESLFFTIVSTLNDHHSLREREDDASHLPKSVLRR